MLWHIAWFEIRYWLRSWMLWIFTLVIAAMFFAAVSTDQLQVGGAISNTFRNAPFVIENYYAIIGLLTMLFATAFVNSAASRDFSHNTYPMVFSTPLGKGDFLFGRFLGSTLVSIIPMLGVSAGILLGKYMPWVEAERWGPVSWGAHLEGILVFAVPNAFFIAAVMFTIAVLTRNDLASFVSAVGLMTAYGVAGALTQNLERERLAALLDPFGIRTFALATKYWTVAEKNNLTIGASGLLLWNRLLWVAVGSAFLVFAYFRFSFAERRTKAPRLPDEAAPGAPAATLLPGPLRPLPPGALEQVPRLGQDPSARHPEKHRLPDPARRGAPQQRARPLPVRPRRLWRKHPAGHLLDPPTHRRQPVSVYPGHDHLLRRRAGVEGPRPAYR